MKIVSLARLFPDAAGASSVIIASPMDKLVSKRNRRGKRLAPSVETISHLPEFCLALALLLAVVSYWPALRYGFVYDDTQQILQNPAITSWRYLPQYFTANVWAGVYPGVRGYYYRPLFLLWLRLNYSLFGLTPWGWHLTSLLAHLAAIGVFFLVFRQWTNEGVAAGWGAVLFAVHPIHIESVAWISAVPEILFTAAGLGAIYSYVRYLQKYRPALLVISAVLYALSLMAKETAIVVWPIIVAYSCWLRQDHDPEVGTANLLETAKTQVPFAAVTATYIGLRIYALRGAVGGKPTHTFAGVFREAPSLVWFYLQKLVIPSGLSPIYFSHGTDSFASPRFYLPLIPVCAVAVGLALWVRKSRATALPALLLLISLLPPLLGVFVFPPHDLAHDRYLYLPSAGMCMLLALAVRSATRRKRGTISQLAFGHLTIAVIALAYVFSARAQEPPYRDNIALFMRAVQISPENATAWGILGEEFMTLGRNAEGIAAFQKAQALEPKNFVNNYRLGAAYYLVKDMRLAEIFFQFAIDNYRDREVYSYDYTLYRLGLSQYAQGKMALAEITLRRACELDPKMSGYHLALAAAMKQQGRLHDARQQLELELKLGADPEAAKMFDEVNAGLHSEAIR